MLNLSPKQKFLKLFIPQRFGVKGLKSSRSAKYGFADALFHVAHTPSGLKRISSFVFAEYFLHHAADFAECCVCFYGVDDVGHRVFRAFTALFELIESFFDGGVVALCLYLVRVLNLTLGNGQVGDDVILFKAKYLCAIEESTRRDINSLKHGYSGKLAISLSPSMSMNFIKNSLSAFARENPQIEYALYEVGINEQTEQLLNGVTEIGVANAKLKQPSRFETLITKNEKRGKTRLFFLLQKFSRCDANFDNQLKN